MTKFVANLALIVAAFFVSLGNFWFTYGIWPRSWAAFVLFVVLSLMLFLIREAMQKDSGGK